MLHSWPDLQHEAQEYGQSTEETEALSVKTRQVIGYASWIGPLVIAGGVGLIPTYPGLGIAGRVVLSGLVAAVGLWASFPRYVTPVACLFGALMWVLAARHAGAEAATQSLRGGELWNALQSPAIWLFVSSLVFARGIEKTLLPQVWFAAIVERISERPWWLLAALMSSCFAISLFHAGPSSMLITIALVLPIVGALAGGDPLRKGLLLGVLWGTLLGQAASLLGSPLNLTIAAQHPAMATNMFSSWLLGGLLPALILLVAAWGYLCLCYPAWVERVNLRRMVRMPPLEELDIQRRARTRMLIVIGMSMLLWSTSPLHGLSTALISCGGILALVGLRIVGLRDLRGCEWSSLGQLVAGLLLGKAAQANGLVDWLASNLDSYQLDTFLVTVGVAYGAGLIAAIVPKWAAGVLVAPFTMLFLPSSPLVAPVAIALTMTVSVLLPIQSTYHSALFKLRELRPGDFFYPGLVLYLITPPLVWFWCALVLNQ